MVGRPRDPGEEDELPRELQTLVSKTVTAHGLDEEIARRILRVIRTRPPEAHQVEIQRILEDAL